MNFQSAFTGKPGQSRPLGQSCQELPTPSVEKARAQDPPRSEWMQSWGALSQGLHPKLFSYLFFGYRMQRDLQSFCAILKQLLLVTSYWSSSLAFGEAQAISRGGWLPEGEGQGSGCWWNRGVSRAASSWRRTHRPACQEGCWEPPLTGSIALEVWALQGAHTKQDVVCVF